MKQTGTLSSISPFFIVRDLAKSADFYCEKLGFQMHFQTPEDSPFFAIVGRDDVSLMLKQIAPDLQPVPNHKQHEWARWDAFVQTPDPDALYRELQERGAPFLLDLADTDDGLRGFEIEDADGYVLFFGRPV